MLFLPDTRAYPPNAAGFGQTISGVILDGVSVLLFASDQPAVLARTLRAPGEMIRRFYWLLMFPKSLAQPAGTRHSPDRPSHFTCHLVLLFRHSRTRIFPFISSSLDMSCLSWRPNASPWTFIPQDLFRRWEAFKLIYRYCKESRSGNKKN
jgi:hypothetical protein